MWLISGVATVALVCAVGALGLRSKGEAPEDAAAGGSDRVAALSVALTAPQPMQWADAVTANGAIAAWQEAVVSAEVSGLRIAQVMVDVGDQVSRGQVLARFDDATMSAAVAQQAAMVAEAQANLAEAAANANRAARLRSTGAISEQDLIQFVTRAQAARAQLDSAEARLQSTRLNLNFTRVVAPDDGVISARNANLGAVSGPGAELFRLVRQNRLEWRAELTAVQLAQVREGHKATLTLPDGSTTVGTVRQLSPVLDEKTRTALAYIELDRTQPGNARAGMYASGRITLGDRAGMAVPASALVLRDGREFVFTVDAENRALETKVETGRRKGNLVEVVSGLKPGQSVIATGAAFLNNGDLVRVTGATGGAAAAGGNAT
jgi:RND family efflux transporter MFP subunit